MKDTVTFYTNPMSRGRTVHWMLEEIGEPYEVKLIDFNKKEQKSPEFMKINPMGKLPAIVHRGTTVTETGAILTYLADAFPKAKLAPSVESAERGAYYRWLFFAAGCVEPALIDKMTNRPPCEKPGAIGYGTYEDTFRTLESALKDGPFLLGEQFTAADLFLAAQIAWGSMMKSVEPRPVFMSFVERCRQRPAFKRFEAKASELAEKMKQHA